MRTKAWIRTAVLLAGLAPSTASAQWAVNGNPICTFAGDQTGLQMAADGIGGAVFTWQDLRPPGAGDIYAQRMGNNGTLQWATNGIPLCTAAGTQSLPMVVHDGSGKLVYVWQDHRGSTYDIYAAVTDRYGYVQTPTDGIVVSSAASDQMLGAVTSNQGVGVAYVAWTDWRSGGNKIYAQAMSSSNPAFWPADGLAVCGLTGIHRNPAIAHNSPGDGAIVAWEDFRSGNYDIYAQTIDLAGSMAWAANGVVVCSQANPQTAPMIVPDGAGGAIIAWADARNGIGHAIYGQHINSSGVRLWAADGVAICISSDYIFLPKMIEDGAGGAILAWEDDRNAGTTGPDIYAQRISGGGSVLWGTNGAVVCNATYPQNSSSLVSDGAGGAIVTWQDLRSTTNTDAYAQHMTAGGSPDWTANGVVAGAAIHDQSSPQIVGDGMGGSLIGWKDRRALNDDLYAQRMETSGGFIGHPKPVILSVTDVPADEGGFVRVLWQPGDGPAVASYQVWRMTDGVQVGGGTGNGSATYTNDVATTAIGATNSFVVIAYNTTNGFESLPVDGASLDNIAPPAPRLRGEQLGPDINLSWNSTAPDIKYFAIERDGVGDFARTGSTSYTDASPPVTQHRYRVRATDTHGNTGAWSQVLRLDMVTGVEDQKPVPNALSLLPNRPNPFRSTTTMRFGLPRAGGVRFEVYNVAGRRVASRDAGWLEAGWRDVTFDGRDNGGRLLPSGIYFYRVRAGSETHSLRMVIGR